MQSAKKHTYKVSAYKVLPLVVMGVVVLLGIGLVLPTSTPAGDVNQQGVERSGYVIIEHIRDGQVISTEEKTNTFTNLGRNHHAYIISTGNANGAFDNIGIGNRTDGDNTMTDGSEMNEYTDCGLTRASGTAAFGQDTGNYSATNTFTSTCDNRQINITSLSNASADQISAFLTFTTRTLQTNDQINVTWLVQYS